ncbi:ABC transporter substrate-binding protein [Halalkaliarchaeum desulfuricum]|uniref:ABC transporter substrate-binding protein n=1 Tax=Halalkaliarchaeum desulfuricum TaxID=2055893 RepID=A0A343TI66_9EURY|nr:ABC transporter substrate-binding protein [Halalkaliarchaeum desulfuricum]AUX08788.1 ABC transporter substrate-binding protein [Halalkaliarchaeum desulfuricum]
MDDSRSIQRGERTSRRGFLAFGGAAVATSLGGCLGDVGETTDTVAFGTLPIAAVAEVFIAKDRGFFADRNIEIETERIAGASQAVPQLASGDLDVASGSIGAGVFNSIAQDVPVRAVADQTQYWDDQPSGNRFWIRAELYEEGMSFSDLPEDPTVAINGEATAMDYLVGRLLQLNDMGWDDVTVTEMPFPDMISAMGSGEIDACTIPDPLGLQVAQETGAGQLLYGSQLAPRMQIATYFFGEPFMEDRPDVARRWLEAYLLGIREYYDLGGFPNEEVASIISEEIDVPVPAIQASIPSLVHKNGRMNVDSLMRQQEFHACRGYLDETVSADEVVDETLLDAALDEVGRLDESEATPSVGTIHEWSETAPAPYAPVGEITVPEGFPGERICE